MTLIMEIMKTIAQPIGELAIWIEETYQVDVNEIIDKWSQLTGMNITIQEGEISYDKVQSLTVTSTSSTKSNKKIPKTKDVCQHIFLSGQKVGEQCTTKPKGGAVYCSAHRPKDSVKSNKGSKVSKKEVKKIDSEFGSDSDDLIEKLKKEKVVKKLKKKGKGITDTDDSGGELVPKKYLKNEDSSDALSEPEIPVKPLLKKMAKLSTKVTKEYNTDDEPLDKDLDLSDDE